MSGSSESPSPAGSSISPSSSATTSTPSEVSRSTYPNSCSSSRILSAVSKSFVDEAALQPAFFGAHAEPQGGAHGDQGGQQLAAENQPAGLRLVDFQATQAAIEHEGI